MGSGLLQLYEKMTQRFSENFLEGLTQSVEKILFEGIFSHEDNEDGTNH